jgi:hypothetical protein
MLKLLGLYFINIQSKIVFEPTTAVKRLIMTPILNVTAKPFIDPVPKIKRINVVIRVVTCESKIVTHAFS